MVMQKALFHNNKHRYKPELDQYISENCCHCQIELTRIEDILVNAEDNYCCEDCNKYYKLSAKLCKEID